jgi:hypothetical protein
MAKGSLKNVNQITMTTAYLNEIDTSELLASETC